jgi:SAM-dependent methyltransferase
MKYRHMTEREDYSPYASGQVLHRLRGHPPLPVRLASEVFLRAYALWNGSGTTACTIYDPLCGSGASLVTLKFLHWERIASILGSDTSPESLEIAALNFELLTEKGLQGRTAKIAAEVGAYGKDSHKNALLMAQYLLSRIAGPVTTRLFRADATHRPAVQAGVGNAQVDIAFLDIPYGRLSTWEGGSSDLSSQEATSRVLAALAAVMSPGGVVALFMPKRHKIQLDQYHRLQRINAGKREVWLLRLD